MSKKKARLKKGQWVNWKDYNAKIVKSAGVMVQIQLYPKKGAIPSSASYRPWVRYEELIRGKL